jgi:ribosomal protein L20A (L18A)
MAELEMYEVKGEFIKKGVSRHFTRKVLANSKNDAQHRVLSLIGAEHGVKRAHIKIERVEKAKEDK